MIADDEPAKNVRQYLAMQLGDPLSNSNLESLSYSKLLRRSCPTLTTLTLADTGRRRQTFGQIRSRYIGLRC